MGYAASRTEPPEWQESASRSRQLPYPGVVFELGKKKTPHTDLRTPPYLHGIGASRGGVLLSNISDSRLWFTGFARHQPRRRIPGRPGTVAKRHRTLVGRDREEAERSGSSSPHDRSPPQSLQDEDSAYQIDTRRPAPDAAPVAETTGQPSGNNHEEPDTINRDTAPNRGGGVMDIDELKNKKIEDLLKELR